MKHLFVKIVLLTVPFLLGAFYVEYNLNKIPNSYTEKKENFEKQIDSIQILVLGNSQALFGIDPTYFNLKGFNLANSNQTLFYDSKITLKYLNELTNLKCVIINISYFSLGSQLIDDIEAWRDYAYYQFWNIKYPELHWYDIKLYSKYFLYTPTKSMSYIVKNFDVDLKLNTNENGYAYMQVEKNKLNEKFSKDIVEHHTSKLNDKNFVENTKEIESLVNELKKRNVKIVFITPPVYYNYYKFRNKDIVEKNLNIIKRICSETDCAYYDYSADKRFLNSDSLFQDSFHLNAYGAELFSKVINEEVLDKTLVY